jgi:hypothetical protein
MTLQKKTSVNLAFRKEQIVMENIYIRNNSAFAIFNIFVSPGEKVY